MPTQSTETRLRAQAESPSPEHQARIDALAAKAGSRFPYQPHFRRFRGALGAYVDEGPRDAPVLLCVHGNPTWSFFYRTLIDAFAGSMRVVVPDHIGMGMSEKPKNFDYRLETRIEALLDLIEHLDLRRITLVAHDWGGAIGLGAAGRQPERFERLVLSNTAAFPGGKAHSLIRIARLPGLHSLLMGRLGLFEQITVHRATERG
ncbi:MAG TPA: alpha/beta fold hydrolase, partial [Planctomycetota bacterium]|nr:alpha/beta fold hydrolase [Planctomycetota bacterium]